VVIIFYDQLLLPSIHEEFQIHMISDGGDVAEEFSRVFSSV
jgi:hypothetical protein